MITFCHVRIHQEGGSLQTRKKAFIRNHIGQHFMVLDFSVSRIVRNIFLLFKPLHLLFLLQQPELTKTPTSPRRL